MVLNATTMRTAGDSLSNRQPIFYHPEMWNNYKNQTALPKVTNVKTNARVMSTRQPLLIIPKNGTELSTRRWYTSAENQQLVRLLINRIRLRKWNKKYRLTYIVQQPNRR